MLNGQCVRTALVKILKLDKMEAITLSEYSRYRYIDKVLSELPAGRIRRICDIGCGTGNLLAALEGYGVSSKGIDRSEESLAIARRKVTSANISIENKDVYDIDEKFDLIFLSQVLEHVEDDMRLLEHVKKAMLNDGGYIILTLPAHKSLYSSFDHSLGHYRRYEKKETIRAISAIGLEPIIFWSYGSIVSHLIPNIAIKFSKDSYAARSRKMSMDERVSKSSIREFAPVFRPFLSKVNILHFIFFWIDYALRGLDRGVEYFVLCRSL